jgi:hypothetical protein
MSHTHHSGANDSNIRVHVEDKGSSLKRNEQLRNEFQRDYGIKFEVSMSENKPKDNITKSSEIDASRKSDEIIQHTKHHSAYENPIIYPDEVETTNLKSYKVKAPGANDENYNDHIVNIKDKMELGKSTDFLNEKFEINETLTDRLKKRKRKSEILLILVCILTAILSIAILAHLMSLKKSIRVMQVSK